MSPRRDLPMDVVLFRPGTDDCRPVLALRPRFPDHLQYRHGEPDRLYHYRSDRPAHDRGTKRTGGIDRLWHCPEYLCFNFWDPLVVQSISTPVETSTRDRCQRNVATVSTPQPYDTAIQCGWYDQHHHIPHTKTPAAIITSLVSVLQ